MSTRPAAPLGRLLPAAAALALACGLLTPARNAAATAAATAAPVTVAWRADQLAITVPDSASLGSGTAGSTLSASLGTVTVVDSRSGNPPWTATVASTDFTTGAPVRTITKANVSYWSGSTTASSGGGTRVPGQPTAAQKVTLTAPATAFSGRKLIGIANSTSWQPTLVVTIPAAAAAGTYTGTITHSVA
ncbi:hypothetical protein ACQPYK_50360 (plasmid) [Streptosporangium sp. CA-135522]|uniref:hypothetical protein n=1 Tax=Streptosporangium sp. CA-135522 TaxID=3240072 RepID=UPI003D906E37